MLVVGWAIFSYAHGDNNYENRNMLSGLKEGDKAAILMVHFGTTYDDTRVLTIDAINQKAQKEFPEMTFKEAYTSRIVIRRLKERGILDSGGNLHEYRRHLTVTRIAENLYSFRDYLTPLRGKSE